MHYKYGDPEVWDMSDNLPFLGVGGTFSYDRLNWKAPLTKSMIYSISLDGYNYLFDQYESWIYFSQEDKAELINANDVEKTMFSIKASLIYHF